MKQGKGSLFFSDKPPEVSGYLVIGDDEFEIVGWRPSPIRTDISVKQTSEASKGRDAGQDGDNHVGSGERESERDTP